MTKTISVPGQIRRYVLKQGRPAPSRPAGEVHLYAACQEGDKELKRRDMNTLNSIDLSLTNAALGAALVLARSWLDSDNGNNVMAAKSMLKFELEYEPDDPREIRHEIKMPKSLTAHFAPQYGHPSPYKDESLAIQEDTKAMSWTGTGAHGRVRAETLGLFLTKMQGLTEHPHSAVQRASKKFLATYTEPYEKTQRLINGYLGTGEDEDQDLEIEAGVPEDQEPAAEEIADPLLDLIAQTPPQKEYEVPANWLELAEEGNTEAARRYWKRRCEEYRRTGK